MQLHHKDDLLSLIEGFELLINLLEIRTHIGVFRPSTLHHLDVLRRRLGLGDLGPTQGRRLLDFTEDFFISHVEHVEGPTSCDHLLHNNGEGVNIPLLGALQQG